MTKLTEFASQEDARLDKEKQEYLDENDMKAFYTMPVGETIIEVDGETTPRTTEAYPNRMVFRIALKDGTVYDWSINVKGAFYRKWVRLLKEGHKKIKVMRIGTSKDDTRYDATALD